MARHSNIQEDQGGTNISVDPLLDATYCPASDSPAIDAGLDSYVDSDTDLAGNPRIVGAAVDMGACESQ